MSVDFTNLKCNLERKGYHVHMFETKEAGWVQRSIKFYDLDGHIIEVGETLKMVVKRFLDSGMTMDETSKRMDVSIPDLEKILNS